MRVEFLPRAEDDIIQQFRYYLVDQDAPLTALRFRESVMASVKQLERHPRMGALFPTSIPCLRSWPVKEFENIRIYYFQAPGSLRVVRILHGKRHVRQILKKERTRGA